MPLEPASMHLRRRASRHSLLSNSMGDLADDNMELSAMDKYPLNVVRHRAAMQKIDQVSMMRQKAPCLSFDASSGKA
jgi:hypothetical protein